jgi:hypothetical protein
VESDSAIADEAAVEDRKLADALFSAGLLEDPTSSDGLVFPLPADAVIEEIVSSYDTRSTGQKVRCAVCPQHQKHFRGFRVALQTGDQARIGIDCGEKQFGKDVWRSVSADFNRRVEMTLLKARVEPTLEAIALVTPLIEEWHRRTNALAKWLNRFRKDVPQLAAHLRSVAKSRDGRLVIERQVWREGVNRNGKRFRHKDVETRFFAQIPFPGMFQGDTPTGGLNGATTQLQQAIGMLDAKVSGLALANAFRAVQRARNFVAEADRAHRGALANLDQTWLQSLCEWASQDDALTAYYEFQDGKIIHDEHGYDDEFTWLTPAELGKSAGDEIASAWPSGGSSPAGASNTKDAEG